ncbi:MAG: hypothetical protein ACI841_001870 [Planctomycetota bacterium]
MNPQATSLAIILLSSSNLAQCQIQKVVPTNGAASDLFGDVVAVSGDSAFVGQLGPAGSIYVYRRSAGSWLPRQQIVPADYFYFDRFASDIAMSGPAAVVSSPLHSHSVASAGLLHLYEDLPGGWAHTQELVASDAAQHDYFGFDAGMDGDVIVAGSSTNDLPGIPNAGAAHVFEGSLNGWVETAKLIALDASTLAAFGWGVAVAGDTIVVSAAQDGSLPRAAYVFESTTNGWRVTQKLTSAVSLPNDRFGGSVAIDGNHIVVGTP